MNFYSHGKIKNRNKEICLGIKARTCEKERAGENNINFILWLQFHNQTIAQKYTPIEQIKFINSFEIL